MFHFFKQLTVKWKTNPWYYAGISLLVATGILRAVFLGSPSGPVFDEVHFPFFAQKYLASEPFFDIHPPTGKWIIAFSELLLGYNETADYEQASSGAPSSEYYSRIIPNILGSHALSWRFFPYLFGMGLLLVLWQIGWHITKSWRSAFIVLFVSSVDSMLFVYGRTGLMDGMMYFFVFASFLSCIVALKQKILKWHILYLLLAGVLAGVAMSIKWLGLAALILCFFWLVFHFSKIKKPYGFVAIVFALLLSVGVYIASFVGEGTNWQQLGRDIHESSTSFFGKLTIWHDQSFSFNKNLKESHPYGSSWWTWPLMLRPVWYYYQQIDPQTWVPATDPVSHETLSNCSAEGTCLARGIIAVGNPVIWWSAFLSFLATFFFVWPKKPWQWALLCSSICMYLPWIFIGRVSFLYYFMGVAIVWQLLLALNLSEISTHKWGRLIVQFVLALAAMWFLAAYPLLTAFPISPKYTSVVLWLRSWAS